MGDGALASDHVNYLVLRYLQESGFETAAKSLYREWNRGDEFRDPEDFPFATSVKQHELVHIIQDGLFHDQLQASVANSTRRFNITSKTFDDQAQRITSISRRQSVYTSNDRDDFAIPPAKRVRQSNASDVVINGDAMDVDGAEEDDRTSIPSEQDRAQSESEPAEQVMIETKVAGTQTEKKKKVKTKTLYWTIDKSIPVTILHTGWSPGVATSSFILAAGESLCRLYNTGPPDSILRGIENLDAVPMTSDHTVTAAAWHPSGQYFTCAIQGPPRVNGVAQYRLQLLDVSTKGDRRPYDMPFNMVTLALRYTKSGNLLFSASSDGEKSLLEARDLRTSAYRRWATAFQYVDDVVVMDIAPISEKSFAVCGKGLVSVWSFDAADGQDESDTQMLEQDYVHTVPIDISYDKIRYDWRHELLVAIATSSGHVCTLRKDGSTWTHGPSLSLPPSAGPRIAAMCFEPSLSSSDAQPPSRLAIALVNDTAGQICLYNATTESIDLVTTLELGQSEPPLALSWAPSSESNAGNSPARLAAASDEAIRIWDVAAEPVREVLSWKAAPANWYQGDDHHLVDEEDATEPSLSWDSGGERLAFAVGRKMAIVSIMNEVEVNGVDGATEVS
ncbi:hypothetical protein CAC42_4663 [Sphaceloma murrayae]|uniref:Uncharacterized protein n=1 Tax=Sphaceloma murrayae TaxID=2082308 RepID=A0A2K1QP25_9PEZI|nr:hypothetical protein CAC42_4663 [Sphaceloma murrayae]